MISRRALTSAIGVVALLSATFFPDDLRVRGVG